MAWIKGKHFGGREVDKARPRLNKYCLGSGVDIGCGGIETDSLSGYRQNKINELAIGVDLSQTQLCGRADNLYWFNDEVLDYIFSSHLLEHMGDIPATIKEWFRVLKPEGMVVMYLPLKGHYPSMGHPDANRDHKMDLSPKILLDLLMKVGLLFEVVYIQEQIEGEEYSFDFVIRKQKSSGWGMM